LSIHLLTNITLLLTNLILRDWQETETKAVSYEHSDTNTNTDKLRVAPKTKVITIEIQLARTIYLISNITSTKVSLLLKVILIT